MNEEQKVDLTYKEDLSIAVMNLISLEEHLAFTAMKTRRDIYLEILKETRKIRINLMKKLVANTEGELWCISKHLLAATMRLMETSTKYLNPDPKRAMEIEANAFDLYSLFWFLQKVGEKVVVKKSRKKAEKK